MRHATVALTLLFGLSSLAAAEEVKVTGVHLCCGKCVKAATSALQGIKGISAPRANQDEEVVTFNAEGTDLAEAGVAALAKAGFAGTATMGGAAVKAPASGIAAGAAGNAATISNMHLCCGGCVRAAEGAIKEVSGVKSVTSDAKGGTIAVSGEAISLEALLNALHEAGFHGSVN